MTQTRRLTRRALRSLQMAPAPRGWGPSYSQSLRKKRDAQHLWVQTQMCGHTQHCLSDSGVQIPHRTCISLGKMLLPSRWMSYPDRGYRRPLFALLPPFTQMRTYLLTAGLMVSAPHGCQGGDAAAPSRARAWLTDTVSVCCGFEAPVPGSSGGSPPEQLSLLHQGRRSHDYTSSPFLLHLYLFSCINRR